MNISKLVVGSYMTNCYFLQRGNDLIIIDPGEEFEKIDDKIKKNNLNLVAILITHAHFDHVGALNRLLDEYKVPVYYNNVNNEIIYDNLINISEEKYKINQFEFEVIYTPGHRNDSVTFYFYNDNVMFTGDFLFKLSVGRMDLEYASIEEMKQSIEKIKQYDGNITLLPGHGDETNIKYEKENNYYLN